MIDSATYNYGFMTTKFKVDERVMTPKGPGVIIAVMKDFYESMNRECIVQLDNDKGTYAFFSSELDRWN